MQHISRASAVVCPLLAGIILLSSSARADISSLTAGTYAYNQSDAGSAAVVGAGSIEITTGIGQARSIWFNQRQDISRFTATFHYREQIVPSGTTSYFAGLTFVLSNSAAGLTAIGAGDSGYGYVGLSPSAAVLLSTFHGNSATGFYRNGVISDSGTSPAPIIFPSNDEINVTLVYDGSLLSVTMTDGALTFGPQNYLVGSLAAGLGTSSAYVGFTASTSGAGTTASPNQYLSDFAYTTPAPTSAALLGMGGVACLRRRRRRA